MLDRDRGGRRGGRAAPCGRDGLTWCVEAPDRAILSGAEEGGEEGGRGGLHPVEGGREGWREVGREGGLHPVGGMASPGGWRHLTGRSWAGPEQRASSTWQALSSPALSTSASSLTNNAANHHLVTTTVNFRFEHHVNYFIFSIWSL